MQNDLPNTHPYGQSGSGASVTKLFSRAPNKNDADWWSKMWEQIR